MFEKSLCGHTFSVKKVNDEPAPGTQIILSTRLIISRLKKINRLKSGFQEGAVSRRASRTEEGDTCHVPAFLFFSKFR